MDYKHLGEGNIPVYGTGGYMLSVDKALSEDKDAIGIGRKGTIDKPYILRAPFWTVDTLFYCIPRRGYDLDFTSCLFQNVDWKKKDESTGVPSLSKVIINNVEALTPTLAEQKKIGDFFRKLDNLITLQQCEPVRHFCNKNMENVHMNIMLFYEYYEQWISVYKQGAIRKVTLNKYKMTLEWIKRLIPAVHVGELTRTVYQQLLNDYAITHEKQTTMDFHHQLKGAILDAVDEGLIERDPTRKVIIKGKIASAKKTKFLSQFELHSLLENLELGEKISFDWLILLIAKTGMRFSEAISLTPEDFDFSHQVLSISKTWDYKGEGGFLPTKNKSSVRKIQIDWHTICQFAELLKDLPKDKPIFVDENSKTYNSTVNDLLERRCRKAGVPVISLHGLRHTHASLLLYAGVTIASVARRLGHASMNTTQKTYLHIIQELENKDVDIVMRSLAGL